MFLVSAVCVCLSAKSPSPLYSLPFTTNVYQVHGFALSTVHNYTRIQTTWLLVMWQLILSLGFIKPININESFIFILPTSCGFYIFLMKQIVCDSFWACLQNCAKRPLASSYPVCMSVCLHGTTWLSLNGFLWNFIFVFFKNSSRKFRFH